MEATSGLNYGCQMASATSLKTNGSLRCIGKSMKVIGMNLRYMDLRY